MIKAILMAYFFIVMLIINIFNDDVVFRAFSMAGAFAAGMFCFYFLFIHSHLLKNKE